MSDLSTPRPESDRVAVGSMDLLAFARSKEDAESCIYSGELFLLRKIAETSSDLVKGRGWPEFRDAVGGMHALEEAHASSVHAWEEWCQEGDA